MLPMRCKSGHLNCEAQPDSIYRSITTTVTFACVVRVDRCWCGLRFLSSADSSIV